MRQKLLWLSTLSLLTSACGCIQIKDSVQCSVAGVLSAGAICSHTLTSETSDLTLDQFIAFLEPQVATQTTPARGAAICMSSDDWGTMKTELETACRELGSRCSYETRMLLSHLK